MKKLLVSALAILMLASAVCGCSTNKNIELNVFETGNRLREGCDFQYPIVQVESSHAINLLKIDENLVVKDDSGSRIYIALNAESPEFILVIEAVDEDAANTINENSVKPRIDTYREGYSDYGPDQVPKIDSCINRIVGRYVFLIISNNNTAAGKLLDSIIKKAPKK